MHKGGVEWLVEAHGCDAWRLRDPANVEALFRALTRNMSLHPLGRTAWHQFPGTWGITAVRLLSESHLTCHTFPEYRSICVNVFCCKLRMEPDFDALLRGHFAASGVTVRRLERIFELEHAAEA